MGIDYAASIMVGLPYEDAIEVLDEDSVARIDEMLRDGELDYCPPCYDAGRDESVIGFEYASTGSYSARSFEWDQKRIDELREQFFEIFGKEAKLYLSPHGW